MKIPEVGRSGQLKSMKPGEWGVIFPRGSERTIVLRLDSNSLPDGNSGDVAALFWKSNDDLPTTHVQIVGSRDEWFRRPVWVLPSDCELGLEYQAVREAKHLHADRQAALIVGMDGKLYCQVPHMGWLDLEDAKVTDPKFDSRDPHIEFKNWFIRLPDKSEVFQVVVNGEIMYDKDPWS